MAYIVCMRESVKNYNHLKLKKAFEESGFKPEFIAKKAGLKKDTFLGLLRGKNRPSLPTLISISHALNREFLDFMD